MDNQYKSCGCEVRLRRLSYTQLSHLTYHILKQGIFSVCGISLLCQQVVAVPVFSSNTVKQIHHPQVVAYHYDTWLRLTNRILPDGVSMVYQYDKYGGVSNIIHYQTPQHQKVITGFTYIYNQDGSIRKRSRIDGLGQQAIEQYGYDDANNLKDYQCTGALCPRDAQGKVIRYQHDTFDEFNNIKTVASNNTLTTYEYDQQIPTRLIGYHNSTPTYPSSQKLIYDRNGNILQDDQGNVITYDPLGQTRSVGTQQGTTTYFYNGEGQQVGEGIPSGQTTYFMYGQDTLLNTRVGSQQTSFLYGANRLGKKDNKSTQYYLEDQGGSVVNTINQTQEATQNINSYAYSPYGIESDLTKQARNTIPAQHFGFDGQLTDSQTNWQFLGQGYRAYNPMLHRFMSQDSLSPFDKGGINGYVFGNNNPIMMSDPTGHMSSWANMGIDLVMGMAAGMLTS
jgi:RHS repeat-associated protein